MTAPARPSVLVDTQWVADHLGDPTVRLVEVSMNPEGYAAAHIPGAVRLGVWEDILLPDERVNEDREWFEPLMSRLGIALDTTIVLYGDAAPWGPGLAFWWLRAFSHEAIRVMNGGIAKWRAEGRPVTSETAAIQETAYTAQPPDWSARATKDDVLAAIGRDQTVILDARLAEEYNGQLFRPGQTPEPGQQAGHIPGAVHVLFAETLADDGTYRPAEELRRLYQDRGVTPDREIIPYCTIGGRSGHTWFVLSQILGYPRVRLYDASWAEWGQTPGLPVE